MIRRSMLPLLFCLAFAGCATATTITPVPQRIELPAEGAELPVTWRDDLMLVDIHVDGRGPFTFVLDTGAATNVVSRRIADLRFDAVVDAAMTTTDAEGREVELSRAMRVGSLRAGSLVLRELAAAVADLEALHPYIRFRLDGILGYPAFENLLLTVDYPARSVRVDRGSLGPVDGESVLDDLGHGTPTVAIRVPDGMLPVLLDTGSREGLAVSQLPADVALAGTPVASTRAITLNGPSRRQVVARLAEPIRIGGHRVSDIETSLTQGRPQIGSRILKHFRITFDPRGRKVRFERQGAAAVMEPSAGIGARFRDDGDGWRVWDVMPGGSAEEKGLVIGDRVTAIDGLATKSENDEALRRRLRSLGVTVNLVVVRDGEEVTLRLPVRRLVP